MADTFVNLTGAGTLYKDLRQRAARAGGNMAPEFSTASTYAVGDFCIYKDVLYRCKTAITTAGAWSSSKWTAVKTMSEVKTLKTDKLDSIDVAAVFSESQTYNVGEYVTHNNHLFRCDTAVTTAGAWDSTKWTSIKTMSEIRRLKNGKAEQSDLEALSDTVTNLSNTKVSRTELAAAFSTAQTYDVGDYVTYNNALYRCTTAITTPGAWSSSKWTAVVAMDDVADIKADIVETSRDVADVQEDVSDLKSALNSVDGEYKSISGTSSKYISMAVTAGDTFIFRNTGNGVVGTVKSQLSGANVEDVVANLAAHTDIEWTATEDADRFYIYFNSNSELVVFRKNSFRYDVYASEEQIETNKSATETNASEIDALESKVGNVLQDSKDSHGFKRLNYDFKAGTTYRIRTGAGILGWLKTQNSNSQDVDIIMQNVPANSDFTWTAEHDAPKLYIYYNAASSISVVENASVANDMVLLNKAIDLKLVAQGAFAKASSGNSYNVIAIHSGHTYAFCVNGGKIGQMATLTSSNTNVETIKTTATYAGDMVLWTASQDAAKVYIYYNTAATVDIYDIGAAQSKVELAMQSITTPYSSIKTYSVGDLVTHGFRLWRCKTEISTAEEWTSDHWGLVTVIDSIKNVVDDAVLAEQITTPDYSVDAVATGAYISEDMSKVGTEIWLFTQSTTIGGQQDGYISMIDAQNYSVMNHQCTHNLGHCGTTDYDPDNDRMIISGADNGAAQTPYTYIYHDVSAWKEESAVAYASQTVDRIDLSALASQYGAVSYLAACWGPRTTTGDKLVYLFGGNNWFLLLMGMGTTELDLGTYTAASSGRYNGTYKVLNYWIYDPHLPWEAYDSVMQGIKMHDGIVYTSNGHRAITVWEWIFKDNHVATVIQHRTPWIDNTGAHSTAQGQGIDYNNGKMIIAISTGHIATIE